jgi:hypothetical protein
VCDGNGERLYTGAELSTLVDIDELRDLLGRVRRERVSRSYAVRIAEHRGFPAPLIDRPRIRLWLRADVERWLDHNRPGWRGK